jgi:hypothetical protein
MLGLCAAILLLGGCNGAPARPAGTTAQNNATASRPQHPTESSIPSGGPLVRNTSTVYTRCTDTAPQVFDTASGTLINIPPPPLTSAEQLTSSACTVTTLADGHQRVVYLVGVRTPSHGLNPETTRTDMIVMDPSSTKPVAVKPFPLTTADSNWYLYPATNGFSVAHTLGGTSIHETITDVAFFDANTLAVTSQAHFDGDQSFGGLNYDGYLTLDGVNAHIFSAADGSELYTLPDADGLLYPVDHGFLLQHSRNGEPGVRYFDMATRSLSGPIAPFLDGSGALDPGRADLNVYGDTVLLADASLKNHIVVFDMAAKKVLFGLDEGRLAGLSISGARLGDHYLYLTNGSDNPVIDYRTAQQVSSGWNRIPLAKLADGWVYVHSATPGSLANEGCTIGGFAVSCAGASAGSDKIVRGAAGDYDGPWY